MTTGHSIGYLCCMSDETSVLSIKDFPAALHRELKALAAKRGVSLKLLVIQRLGSFFNPDGTSK